ncbi:hypothetical protein SLEP1_g12360 [Rubroshorea leprosula]|uniref:Uncharacterized protein n=1 Tax=Rubroshorea leprosula TaxID=152421 RepID=A0AAV5ILP8_9ROSI|nr:hypothetical protein SLEP1_g12360 [Rubroshorea leprosula]
MSGVARNPAMSLSFGFVMNLDNLGSLRTKEWVPKEPRYGFFVNRGIGC